MRKIPLFAVLILLLGTQPAIAAACSGLWFEGPRVGHLTLLDFTNDSKCIWDGYSKHALQRSGACGLPQQKNDFMVLTHNWLCGWYDCPDGSIYDGEWNIPLLKAGQTVKLCDGATLWQGKVISNTRVTRDMKDKINPQQDFRCAGEKCGTIVTSVGVRYWTWGPADYALVRISYTRAR